MPLFVCGGVGLGTSGEGAHLRVRPVLRRSGLL